MSKVICEKEDLVAIADATRQATGSTETYNVPSLRNAVINTFAQGIGGADWAENDPDSSSYVENRTHWVEENENIAVLSETTVEAGDGDMPPIIQIPFNEPLEEGKTYTIVLNGETYVSECALYSEDGITLPLLGNYKIITTNGAESTGEPFIIMYLTEEAKAAMGMAGMPIYAMLQILEEITFPATLSITTDGTTYHKLNPRFLPDGGVGWEEAKSVTNLSFVDYTWEQFEQKWFIGVEQPFNYNIVPGQEYKVNYNGELYTCVAETYTYQLDEAAVSAPVIGNLHIIDAYATNNYIPFIIMDTTKLLQYESFVSNMGNTYATVFLPEGVTPSDFPISIEVVGEDKKIHKIDKKYLPDGSDKMNANNPTGTGAFSMGRKEGSVVGENSHAEGKNTIASDACAHAEGMGTKAESPYSHTEGRGTRTVYNAPAAHAEGYQSAVLEEGNTDGDDYQYSLGAHAEGWGTKASGKGAHSEGVFTTARGEAQHVQGVANITDTENKYAHIVGNGTYKWDAGVVKVDKASNAHTLDWEGNAWYAGNVYVGDGTEEKNRLATKSELTASGGIGWTEEGGEVTLWDVTYTEEELTSILEDGVLTAANPIGLVDGITYKVTWEGTEYESTAVAASPQTGINIVYIGNASVIGGNNTGEPFFVCDSPDGSMGIGFMAVIVDPVFPFTAKIVGGGEIIHGIDPKYLPKDGFGWTENKGAVKKELFSSTITATEYTEDTGGKVSESSGPLIPGETYIVNYNGTEYECLCESRYDEQVQRDASFIGNMLPFGNKGETPGEPFYIVYTGENQVPGMEDYVAFVVLRYDFEHTFPCTITVSTQGEKIHKIDEKYIPNATKQILFTPKEDGTYQTSIPFSEAWEMSAAQLQQAISIIWKTENDEQELSVFGLSKKVETEMSLIIFYVMPGYYDSYTAELRRITWAKFNSQDFEGADSEAFIWPLKEIGDVSN